MGRIIELVLLFFVVRFIIKIIEGFFMVKQVKQNFENQFSNYKKQQQAPPATPTPPPATSQKPIDKDDYIDYEDVKSELK